MIGDNAKGIIAQTRNLNFPMRPLIHLKGEKLKYAELPQDNPDLVYTSGLYYLKYANATRRGDFNIRPFMIRIDFGHEVIRLNGYSDFLQQAETNDYVRYLAKYTNISRQHFYIAAQNPSMQIPFSLDIAKYDADVRAKWGANNSKYAMIYNPYKEKEDDRWVVNEDEEFELTKKAKKRADNK